MLKRREKEEERKRKQRDQQWPEVEEMICLKLIRLNIESHSNFSEPALLTLSFDIFSIIRESSLRVETSENPTIALIEVLLEALTRFFEFLTFSKFERGWTMNLIYELDVFKS